MTTRFTESPRVTRSVSDPFHPATRTHTHTHTQIGKYERKSGPNFSFGKGRGDRFSSAAGMLKEDF